MHRDVKPQNVLVPHGADVHCARSRRRSAAVAKLTDFGGAQLSGSGRAHAHGRRARHARVHGARAERGPRGGRGVRRCTRWRSCCTRRCAASTRCAARRRRRRRRRIGRPVRSLARARRDLPRELSADDRQLACTARRARAARWSELREALDAGARGRAAAAGTRACARHRRARRRHGRATRRSRPRSRVPGTQQHAQTFNYGRTRADRIGRGPVRQLPGAAGERDDAHVQELRAIARPAGAAGAQTPELRAAARCLAGRGARAGGVADGGRSTRRRSAGAGGARCRSCCCRSAAAIAGARAAG